MESAPDAAKVARVGSKVVRQLSAADSDSEFRFRSFIPWLIEYLKVEINKRTIVKIGFLIVNYNPFVLMKHPIPRQESVKPNYLIHRAQCDI